MSRPRIEAPFLCPRKYVPKELKHARIGSIDDGALALAHTIKRRFMKCRYRHSTVVVDIDGSVYASMRPGPTIEYVRVMFPELIAGTYTPDADAADIASDLETFRRAM